MMRPRRAALVSISTTAALLAAGCSLAPQVPPAAVFDFGPPPQAATGRPLPALRVVDISAPAWLDGTGIAYRLEHLDAYRREVYRDSRWAAPPAALLTSRLQQRAAGGSGAAATLSVHLDEFTQVFSSPTQSRAVVRLRARLVPAGTPAAASERLFVVEREAASADARGAVRALAAASDEALDRVLSWAAAP